MIQPNYTYRAKVISVYDGDTARMSIDLGFGIIFSGLDGKGVALRFFGINAPEVRGEEKEKGKQVRDFVKNRILDQNIVIRTIKDKKGKYGRYLVEIFYINQENSQINLNEQLVKLGYAEINLYD